MALKYPCTNCQKWKPFARRYRFGNLWHPVDCHDECEEYKAWAKECDDDTGDGVGQTFSPD